MELNRLEDSSIDPVYMLCYINLQLGASLGLKEGDNEGRVLGTSLGLLDGRREGT